MINSEVMLSPKARALLRELAAGRVHAVISREGSQDLAGRDRERVLDALAKAACARRVEQRGDNRNPSGTVWNVYEITPLGRDILNIEEARQKADSEL